MKMFQPRKITKEAYVAWTHANEGIEGRIWRGSNLHAVEHVNADGRLVVMATYFNSGAEPLYQMALEEMERVA
jgi:hypothetical protein